MAGQLDGRRRQLAVDEQLRQAAAAEPVLCVHHITRCCTVNHRPVTSKEGIKCIRIGQENKKSKCVAISSP